MINNIIYGSGTISIPTGLSAVLSSVDVHSGQTANIYDGVQNYTFDGLNTNLTFKFDGDDMTVIVTGSGYANIGITYVGDQNAYRLYGAGEINPSNKSLYPGARVPR